MEDLLPSICFNGDAFESPMKVQCPVKWPTLCLSVFIVAFLENATIGYSLESVCVCVRVCVCVCFCTITQKEIDLGTRNWNTL